MSILTVLAASAHCFWCGNALIDHVPGDAARGTDAFHRKRTRDHLISRRHGGTFTVWSCRACNELKGSMDPVEFHKTHRPAVSAELFAAALKEAKGKRICPLVAGHLKRPKRKKKLSLKKQKLAAYYDGVYVTGYSSKNPLRTIH
jgi:hypothetical protein